MPNDAKGRIDSPVELWKDVSCELWEVQLLGGGMRHMTVDELEAAFARQQIHPRTPVRRQGTATWMTLREARGLGPAPHANAIAATSRRPPLPNLGLAPQPPAEVRLRRSSNSKTDPFQPSIEELAVVRPSSAVGKIIAFAAVALVGGGILAAMTAKATSPRVEEPEVTTTRQPSAPTVAAASAAPPVVAPVATTSTVASATPRPTPQAADDGGARARSSGCTGAGRGHADGSGLVATRRRRRRDDSDGPRSAGRTQCTRGERSADGRERGHRRARGERSATRASAGGARARDERARRHARAPAAARERRTPRDTRERRRRRARDERGGETRERRRRRERDERGGETRERRRRRARDEHGGETRERWRRRARDVRARGSASGGSPTRGACDGEARKKSERAPSKKAKASAPKKAAPKTAKPGPRAARNAAKHAARARAGEETSAGVATWRRVDTRALARRGRDEREGAFRFDEALHRWTRQARGRRRRR